MSISHGDPQFALDMQGLTRLKSTAKADQGQGLKEASRQFEALFLAQMLKSMRDTIPKSDADDSGAMDMYTSMFDAQLAQNMAGRGMGFADMIEREMRNRGLIDGSPKEHSENLISGIPQAKPRSIEWTDMVVRNATAFNLAPDRPNEVENPFKVPLQDNRPRHVQDFIRDMAEPAKLASRASGVPAELIVAQAALETGWGKSRISTLQGTNSHNLFGIKAGSHWTGKTTEITTTEFVNGRSQKQIDRFRVYDSYTDSFADYARLISKNPRYQHVVHAPDAPSAARALQSGGYATDPSYADKLISVMKTVGPLESVQVAQRDIRLDIW